MVISDMGLLINCWRLRNGTVVVVASIRVNKFA